ncbi:DUF58 domain-containing protein [Deinococcus peraridilitoris]|uniref:DUF58 domain-containing protein n=1 Tax=Deinococcus peraridilitoris (strain DSM 19664 / LMG 22246 / CIP 109416 / KR-200) TaxID=937777 RepID=L0A5Q5_DEIPD|nr:DUF58 domain-containing protein [Deinococcus peraridilitoris]AFZ69176.1 hypothetical protein Deipe_3751 [Deinococcus peraridilitoris DSM 19664]
MRLLSRRVRPAAPRSTAPAPAPAPAPIDLPAHLLRRLEFKVLRRLDGFLFGDYRGLFYGPSLDLAEVREYQPGDEVRRIDWNVTARSGRLHVRQYREERELTAWLVVDLSSSMNFGTRRVLKRDLAREFAGLASLVVTRHGDKIGAMTFGSASDASAMLAPRSGRAQALAVLNLLSGQGVSGRALPSARGGTDSKRSELDAALSAVERTLRRRSLVFVVSDFLELPPQGGEGWTGALGRLAQRHDVVAVRISDPAERELPSVGGLRLRDPESGAEQWIDTSDPRVRAAHARLVGERDRALKAALRAAQVDLLELDTQRDTVQPLLRFAASRRGRRT